MTIDHDFWGRIILLKGRKKIFFNYCGKIRVFQTFASPLMTRAAPASAPIFRPGVKGAGRGRGAADVSWASRSSRREELPSRRNIWVEMTQWAITGDWASFLKTPIEKKLTLKKYNLIYFFLKNFLCISERIS